MFSGGTAYSPNYAVSLPGQSNPTGIAFGPNGASPSTTPVDSGAGASSGMGGAMAGNTAISAGAAAASIISSITGYLAQKTTMESQAKMQTMALDHQDKMAVIDKDMKLNLIETESTKQQVAVSGNKAVLDSAEKLKKAQDGMRCTKAEIAEVKATNKAHTENDKGLDKLFRGSYGYGNPF